MGTRRLRGWRTVIAAATCALWACSSGGDDDAAASAGAPAVGTGGTTVGVQPSGPAAGGAGGTAVGASGSAASGRGSSGSGGGESGRAGDAPPVAGSSGAGGPSGGPPDAGADAPDAQADAGPTGPTFPAVTDLQADGPYAGAMLTNTGPSGNYTVYHPRELGPGGAKHPIVGWMSGGSTQPSWYTLLPRLATHGFVVVASNTVPTIGAEIELGREIIAGIDWILAQEADPSSMWSGKLDRTKIASMGYSMGGLATTTIADDPRLTTTVHVSGGNMVIERIQKLRAPAAFICGETDIANPNCATDFEAATTPVFYGVFLGGDHLGILIPPYADRIRGAATGWLRWQLMNDEALRAMFVGSDCTLCKDTANWDVKQKNLD
jgi:dienelactone hydrolase